MWQSNFLLKTRTLSCVHTLSQHLVHPSQRDYNQNCCSEMPDVRRIKTFASAVYYNLPSAVATAAMFICFRAPKIPRPANKTLKIRYMCSWKDAINIFLRGLRYDEKYIAEFIFICLSAKSESSPMRRMINEDAATGVHQDLYPSSKASSALEHKISFRFPLLMRACSFRDIRDRSNHTWWRISS